MLLALALAIFAGDCLCADSAQRGEKIRVLLTTGGHGFETEPFYAMFDAMPGIEYTKAELPKDAGLLKPGLEKQYDVIVMYDMSPPITPDQQKSFVALLERGIGLVSLHHNLGAHRDWDEFRKIIGGKFVFEDCVIDGKPYSKTPWSHGEDLNIEIADGDHPITRGMKDFAIHDETYGRFYVAPGVHVLLKTDHPKNNPVVAWTTQYGSSRVFYLMLGHDSKAYANPNYRALLEQGIRWTAAR
jgi:hypothetical protein